MDQITVANHTRFDISLAVAGSQRGGQTLLGVAEPTTDTTIAEVVDQGATWTFTFWRANANLGEVTVGRAQLAAEHWRVVIPQRFETTLVARGQEPPPH